MWRRLQIWVPSLTLAVAWLAPAVGFSQDGMAPIRDNRRSFSKHVISWRQMRDLGVVKQQRDYSCGAAAVATIAQYYWRDDVNEQSVLTVLERILTPAERADRVQNGMSLTDLRRAAVEMGYQATIARAQLSNLANSRVPVIVPIRVNEHDHFAVLRGVTGNTVHLADPIRGNVRVTASRFQDQWIEGAFLVIAKPGMITSDGSLLYVAGDEYDFGWLNYQGPRRLPQYSFPKHIR